jgi:hypothetical protein
MRKLETNFPMWIVGLLSIAEGLVIVLSLGAIEPHWRADFLFSDLCERMEERHERRK